MLCDSTWDVPHNSLLYSLFSVSQPIQWSENRIVVLFVALFMLFLVLSLGS